MVFGRRRRLTINWGSQSVQKNSFFIPDMQQTVMQLHVVKIFVKKISKMLDGWEAFTQSGQNCKPRGNIA